MISILAGLAGGIIGGIFITFGPIAGPFALGGSLVGAAICLFLIFAFIVIQTIKFFIGLAKCYINILFRVIFAPLEIGMGAIPNSKMNFSSWIWNLVANLAVFPVSIIFLVLINLILASMEINSSSLWAPPMLDHPSILRAVIGICAYMMLAKLPTLIPEAIFNIKPSPLGKAIGESFASTSKTVTGASRYGINQFGGKLMSDYAPTDADGNIVSRTKWQEAKYAFGKALEWKTKK